MNRSLGRLARLTAMYVGPAVVVALVLSGASPHLAVPDLLRATLIALVFSCCIAPLCAVVLPRVARKTCDYHRLIYWTAMIASMIALAAVGSLLALLILTALGYLSLTQVVGEWHGNALRVSVMVTLIIGTLVSIYQSMRGERDQARLALRTKERDEAHAQRLLAEAQLSSLESRVHPHFLFNTLNSIAALIPRDPAGAEKMTEQLASLLRSSLDAAPTAMVPLEQELKVVRDYLDIERVRFGPRLRFDIRLDQALADVRVPRMSLQTLVENCVKYAVAPRREGGSILVSAVRSNGCIRLSVSDDGPGFDGAQLPAGHGLELIKSRLEALFGDRARLSIAGRAGDTTVAIELPS